VRPTKKKGKRSTNIVSKNLKEREEQVGPGVQRRMLKIAYAPPDPPTLEDESTEM